ncbi:Alpha-2-macroglobulin RAP, N-terminal domain [Popillia japonica]|uniref:Alpha-2-macroglobulin RAP, N-terminal domain n=1 Tax=Popillia japonica TaxID=7064 RepID=A0AAW1IYR3_POPJA
MGESKIEEETRTLKDLEKPFRMQKVNLLWAKAKLRLTEPKLKSLFGALKLYDKEELVWKKIKSDGQDKDGLREAELRKKFLEIMTMYGLLDNFEDAPNYSPPKMFNEESEDRINKSLFKDKKLNKLWSKIETAGFTSIELKALQEEFTHHQDKIDQYYSLLTDIKESETSDEHENSIDNKLDRFNMLETGEEVPKKDYLERVNEIRDKHRDIKDGYDRLHILAAKGPNSKEFVEPKVQGLWKIALETDFTADELESLRIELMHYENRLLKLRHMQVEAALNEDYNKGKMAGLKTDGLKLVDENIKKQARKVDKIHLDLETKIMQKHIEL